MGHKLRPSQQQLVDTLLPQIAVPADGEITAQSLFGDDRPLHLEIGFGSGEHLAYRADLLPDHGFIGAEPFINGVATALGHVRDRHLANVRLHMGDALEVLRRLPDGALSFVYLLHPDPWPKARHAKRRMVNDGPLDLFAAKLQPGGEFRLATDHPIYLEMGADGHAAPHAPVRMAGRKARGFPRAAPAAGPKPATAPSPAAKAAVPIICAIAEPSCRPPPRRSSGPRRGEIDCRDAQGAAPAIVFRQLGALVAGVALAVALYCLA